MRLNDKEYNGLQKEIDHIIDSGANSIRLLDMFNTFLERRNNSTFDINTFYKEMYERMKILENKKESEITQGRINELQLIIVRVQQLLLETLN